MTKQFETAIVGDIIKSYDFVGHTGCYMIGEVVEIDGNNVLICRMIKQVQDNMPVEAERMAPSFRTPQMGECMTDGKFDFNRVTIVG